MESKEQNKQTNKTEVVNKQNGSTLRDAENKPRLARWEEGWAGAIDEETEK